MSGPTGSGRKKSVSASNQATTTNVAASATSIDIMAANDFRTGAFIWNYSTDTLYIRYGTDAADTSDIAVPTASGVNILGGFTGAVQGIWTGTNGGARVTVVRP